MKMLRLVGCALAVACMGALGCGDGTESSGTGGTGGAGGTGDTGGVGGTGGMMFEPGPTCIAFCAKVVGECDALVDVPGFGDVDEASCQQICERDLHDERAVSEACGDAVEAVFVCASELDCQGVEGWLAQEPAQAFPCRSEVVAADTRCAQN